MELICAVLLTLQELSTEERKRAEELIEQLGAESIEERDAAAAELAKLRRRVLPLLEKALEGEEDPTRKSHLLGLVDQITVVDLESVLTRLGNAKDPELRRSIETLVRKTARATNKKLEAPAWNELKADVRSGYVNLSKVENVFLLVDGSVEIGYAMNSIILAKDGVKIGHSDRCVVLAGYLVEISHEGGRNPWGSIIVSGGRLHTGHAEGSVLAAGASIDVAHAKGVHWLNTPKRTVSHARGCAEVQDAAILDFGGLAAAPNPLAELFEVTQIVEGDDPRSLALIRMKGEKGEVVARPNEEITDSYGKRIEALRGWKLMLVARSGLIFRKEKETAVFYMDLK